MSAASTSSLSSLRAELARLERPVLRQEARPLPVCAGIELPGGGLARGALHEVLAAAPGCGAAFCATLLGQAGGTVLWIHAQRAPHIPWPPGLARCGLPPERLVLVEAPSPTEGLWAMEEALRCRAVAGVVLAIGPLRADLTATRRLHLAAETGGGIGLLLEEGAGGGRRPSAATTRWFVSPRGDLSEVSNNPRWSLELLRARGGRPTGPWPVLLRNGALFLEEG
ncbi:ImuA family protein [Pseudoroseomonas globiformis]|uniref:ImuA family protein n=1 Tax=Teichococcus globiformis TaxID=2307229 RepID=A0ABV7G436_9PROT